jgi:hypothetical protein
MTRKLTDEQVKAIEVLKEGLSFVKIPINEELAIVVQVVGFVDNPKTYWQVFMPIEDITTQNFKTPDEAIAYAEHLLNERYQWLPQNNGWIMSGVAYTFKDAGKVLELMHLAEQSGYDFQDGELWWVWQGNKYGYSPDFKDFDEGITIPAESPIWQAVKGVE